MVHFGGLLSTQEARVALGYRLVRLLRILVSELWENITYIYTSLQQRENFKQGWRAQVPVFRDQQDYAKTDWLIKVT